MNDKLNLLLRQLRKLDRAYDRMIRGVPDPVRAGQHADRAFQSVLYMLEDPEIAKLIETNIALARNQISTEQFDEELSRRHQDVTLVEMKLSQQFGLRRRELEFMYQQYSRAKDAKGRFVSGSDAIRDRLTKAHNAARQQIAASRTFGRKGKKKRKRSTAQAIASAVFGTAVIASNTQLPIVFAFSYGLGGGALHQALRDIVGTTE